MNTATNIPPMDGPMPNDNAVSLYNQDGGIDDFPVLKAFQQYIDAEQSKARKRMVYLSIFFGVLMTILIVVFVGLLMMIQQRNQALNDRLIEFAMKERLQPAPAEQANPQKDAAIKAMTEALTSLQKQMIEQQTASAKELAAAKEKAAARTPSQSEIEHEKIVREDALKLKKVRETLKAEKDRLAAEKERLRQQEIELQRRRLYPEYYRKQAEQSRVDELDSDDEINLVEPRSYLDEDEGLEFDEDRTEAPKKTTAKPKQTPAKKTKVPAKAKSANADDEVKIPVTKVPARKSRTGFDIQ